MQKIMIVAKQIVCLVLEILSWNRPKMPDWSMLLFEVETQPTKQTLSNFIIMTILTKKLWSGVRTQSTR